MVGVGRSGLTERAGRGLQPDRQADASIGARGYEPPAVRPGLAGFLTGYGRWLYVLGPVFAAGLVVALAG